MSGFNSTLSRSLGPNALGAAGREMEDLFDRLFHPMTDGSSNKWAPPISVWEEGEHYYLEMDLPGVEMDDIDLTFEDKRLKIVVRRENRGDVEGRKYLYNERWWGEASRFVAIPDSVDADSIEATYANGVLRVQLTKRSELLPKKIEIRSN